jgi:MFS family permease
LSTGLTATTDAGGRARVWRLVFGDAQIAPLSVAQAVAGVGDAFVTVSLAGSLFFNLSPDASREQVLLYLIVTVSPLAVLAPLIGPTVDRFRHRQRLVAALCYLLRGAFCVAMAATLFQLSFYGFALGLLIVGKASGIVKQALIPMLVHDPSQLVSTNARLARTGSIVGGLAAGTGLAVQRAVDTDGLLRCAALVYVGAALVISRLKPPPTEIDDDLPTAVEYAETHAPPVIVGSIGFMAIRGAVGFFVFTLAFTLRQASEPKWVYAAAIGIYGTGAFLGNLVAPILRRRFHDQQLIAIAIAGPTVPTVIGILGVSRPLLLVIAALIGLSTTLGRHGFDSLLQHRAPAALRGRAAARYETRFQLVWALGAMIATPISLPAEASMAVLAALYIPALIVFLRAANEAQVFEDEVALDVLSRAGSRLASAEESLASGAHSIAVIDAVAAVDLARLSDSNLSLLQECIDLGRLRSIALDRPAEITLGEATEAVSLAKVLLSSARAESPL